MGRVWPSVWPGSRAFCKQNFQRYSFVKTNTQRHPEKVSIIEFYIGSQLSQYGRDTHNIVAFIPAPCDREVFR